MKSKTPTKPPKIVELPKEEAPAEETPPIEPVLTPEIIELLNLPEIPLTIAKRPGDPVFTVRFAGRDLQEWSNIIDQNKVDIFQLPQKDIPQIITYLIACDVAMMLAQIKELSGPGDQFFPLIVQQISLFKNLLIDATQMNQNLGMMQKAMQAGMEKAIGFSTVPRWSLAKGMQAGGSKPPELIH